MIGFIGGLLWLQVRSQRLPAAGLLFAGAALAGLRQELDAPTALVLGVAALGGAGLVCELLRLPLLVRAAASVPGALLVGAQSDVGEERWVPAAVVATIVVGGTLATDLDRRWRRPSIGQGLVALSVLAVYVNVPDTEAVLLVIAPAVVAAALTWPLGIVRMGSGGAYASVAVLAWITAFGGVGRAGSIVGGLASLGLLAAEPASRIVVRFRGPLVRRPGAGAAVGMGMAHLLVVGATARIAGLRATAEAAAPIAAVVLALAFAGCVAVAVGLRRR